MKPGVSRSAMDTALVLCMIVLAIAACALAAME